MQRRSYCRGRTDNRPTSEQARFCPSDRCPKKDHQQRDQANCRLLADAADDLRIEERGIAPVGFIKVHGRLGNDNSFLRTEKNTQ
jgi:hypothetical protein